MNLLGIDCTDIGRAMVIRRNGERITLSLEETVKLCKESIETGMEFHQILKKTIPDLKIIRFVQDME